MLVGGEARHDDVLELALVVDGGDDGIARAGQRAGAFGDFARDSVEAEMRSRNA